MKKALFARGILGSLSLVGVIGAIGCSGDVMDEGVAGEGEIGSVEQALTTVNTVENLADAVSSAGGAITDPVGRHWSASCKVTLSGVDYMLIHGGYDSTGAGLDETYIFKPTNPDSWTQVESIGSKQLNGQPDPAFQNQARGQAQFLKLDATSCLLVGGLSARENGTARVRTFKAQVTAANAVTWTQAGDLNAGRAFFGVNKCGTGSKAIVMSGSGVNATVNMGSPITGANAMEVWNGSNAWTAVGSPSGVDVFSVHVTGAAFAAKSDNLGFVIAGGYDGSIARSEVQTFTANNDCTTITRRSTSQLKDSAGSSNLPRVGAVAMIQPGTSDLIVVGGEDNESPTSSLVDHADLFTVPFSATSFSVSARLTSLTGVRFPSTAYAAPSSKFVLAGGETNTIAIPDVLTSAPIAAAQEYVYTAGAWTHGTDVNITARSGAALQYLDSESKFYATSGLSDDSPFSLTTITESIQ